MSLSSKLSVVLISGNQFVSLQQLLLEIVKLTFFFFQPKGTIQRELAFFYFWLLCLCLPSNIVANVIPVMSGFSGLSKKILSPGNIPGV